MIKKQTKNNYSRLQKILTIAGILLVIVGCIANMYGIYNNLRFINGETMSWMYYFRYILLLGGGFVIGYLITKKSEDKLFAAALYASLAIAFSLFFETIRIILYSLLGNLPESLGDWLFFGAPILSLLAAALVALACHVRKEQSALNIVTKVMLITAFLAYEVYTLAASIYFYAAGNAVYDNVPSSVLVGSLLTLPVIIALVSYLVLSKIKVRLDRVFYATFIATMYAALTTVFWEFRTDPSVEATETFSIVATITTLLFAGIVLLLSRKALK